MKINIKRKHMKKQIKKEHSTLSSSSVTSPYS